MDDNKHSRNNVPETIYTEIWDVKYPLHAKVTLFLPKPVYFHISF